jgi:hypothetical protein
MSLVLDGEEVRSNGERKKCMLTYIDSQCLHVSY